MGMTAMVFIDDNRIDYDDTKSDSTVGQFIMTVEEQLSGLERVISGVSINGVRKNDWHANDVFGRLLRDLEDVRIYTSTMTEVANAGVEACKSFLSLISSSGASASAFFRAGNTADGVGAISRMLDYSYELVKTVRALDHASRRHNLDVFKSSPVKHVEAIISGIDSLRKAVQAKNGAKIIEVMDKDISPAMENLVKCFDKTAS